MPGIEIPRISEEPTEQIVPTVDQRWEPDKAADLAHVLKEEGPLDEDAAYRDQVIESPGYEREASELAEIERQRAQLQEDYEASDPDSDKAKMIKHTIDDYDDQIKVWRNTLETKRSQSVEDAIGRVHRNADRFLLGEEELREHPEADSLMKGPEDIYDANPGLFATMPTAEFMTIVRQGEKLSHEIVSWTETVAEAKDYIENIDAATQEKKAPAYPFLRDYMSRFSNLNCRPGEKMNEIMNSDWEKNGEEKTADYKAVFSEVVQECETHLASTKAKLEEFMAKYAPTPIAEAPEVAPES